MGIQLIDNNADVVGTVAGPFNISGTNDQLQITIDGGSPQTISLTHGATQTAQNVVDDINASLTGATAFRPSYGPQAQHVRIRTTTANGASSSIQIGSPSNNANSLLGFTAATYVGAVHQYSSWAQPTGTKQELIDQIETVLLASKWTTVSGSGTTNLLMQSALSPPGQDNQMRVRIKGTNTNCVSISIETVDGSLASGNSTTAGGQLLPASGKTWYFVTNKYQAFIFTGVTVFTAKEFVAFGIPVIPAFLQGVVTRVMWMQSGSVSDTSGTLPNSFRTAIGVAGSTPNMAWIMNNSIADNGNNTGLASSDTKIVQLLFTSSDYNSNFSGNASNGCNWPDGSSFEYDAFIVFNQQVIGQIWEAFVVSEKFTGDTTFTLPDGTNCIVLTHNGGGTLSRYPKGSLILVTP